MAIRIDPLSLLGAGAALAAAAQILVLTQPGVGTVLVAAAAVVGIFQLWCVRKHLNQHVDMIVLMACYGGLGMLLGGPGCHLSPAMWIGMFVAGLPPTIAGSRCVQDARRSGRLALVLIADLIGMSAGMYFGHLVFLIHNARLHHASMLLGMLLGMALAAALLERFPHFGARRRASSSLPAPGNAGD